MHMKRAYVCELLVLYAKPSDKRLIIPGTTKKCFKSIQKHPDSICENDFNNEQNVRAYYVPNH